MSVAPVGTTISIPGGRSAGSTASEGFADLLDAAAPESDARAGDSRAVSGSRDGNSAAAAERSTGAASAVDRSGSVRAREQSPSERDDAAAVEGAAAASASDASADAAAPVVEPEVAGVPAIDPSTDAAAAAAAGVDELLSVLAANTTTQPATAAAASAAAGATALPVVVVPAAVAAGATPTGTATAGAVMTEAPTAAATPAASSTTQSTLPAGTTAPVRPADAAASPTAPTAPADVDGTPVVVLESSSAGTSAGEQQHEQDAAPQPTMAAVSVAPGTATARLITGPAGLAGPVPVRDVPAVAAQMASQGGGRVTLALNPDGLGTIVITVERAAAGVSVSVRGSSAAVAAIGQSSVSDALTAKGLTPLRVDMQTVAGPAPSGRASTDARGSADGRDSGTATSAFSPDSQSGRRDSRRDSQQPTDDAYHFWS